MDESIRRRCLAIADYMLAGDATVRQAARVFGISKSSVHKDMRQHLAQVDPARAARIGLLLASNKAVCHLRGGEATRQRYARLRALQSAP